MKRILITGGAGFIGSNFVRYMLDKYNDYKNNHYMRFYNREKELALMFLLDRNKPSFLVITGKRRIGKTELIRQ